MKSGFSCTNLKPIDCRKLLNLFLKQEYYINDPNIDIIISRLANKSSKPIFPDSGATKLGILNQKNTALKNIMFWGCQHLENRTTSQIIGKSQENHRELQEIMGNHRKSQGHHRKFIAKTQEQDCSFLFLFFAFCVNY